MAVSISVRRWGRCAGCAAAVCLWAGLSGGPRAYGARGAPASRRAVVLTPWEVAEKSREALEAMPGERRSRADYERVRDAYRAVYHDAPGDMHAAAAVNAVAELLAEEGRGAAGGSKLAPSAGSARTLKAAVGQYEFLRSQYPGSSLRVAALLAEAQLEQNDLGDRTAARLKYEELLTNYPRSASAEEARAGLQSLGGGGRGEIAAGVTRGTAGEAGASASLLKDKQENRQGKGPGEDLRSHLRRDETARKMGHASVVAGQGMRAGDGGGDSSASVATPTSKDRSPGTPVSTPASKDRSPGIGATGETGTGDIATGVTAGGSSLAAMATTGSGAVLATVSSVRRTGPLATVKGIRHWSTPNYTRVAIDLGDSVTYEAARVANPDRIYFDLHGTRLAGELVGKSFGVTDDGFLKRIRAAQFSDDMTRVVLDVNDVTEYSAFLLPNPYRLIIDIHGGGKAGQPMAMMGAPAVAAKPAPTVPNTTAVRGATPGELARVSEQPGKVEATREPTSKPIAATVVETQGRAGNREQGTGNSGLGTVGDGEQGISNSGQGTAGSRDQRVGGAWVSAAEIDRSGGSAAGSSVDGSLVASSGTGSTRTAGLGTVGSSRKRGRRGKVTAADGKVVGDPATPARAAVPTASGETSLVRALGLKIGRIVIDAGHGGHDSGTLGVDGIEEKDVVLDVALRLGAMLKERLGAEVIYTRSDDTFIPLETRTAIANKAQADLFLSIHANSSEDASARGVETYYLNFTTQVDALEVAARENAVSDQSIHQLSDLVKKIALKDKIAESREFASDVETSLYGGLQAGNAGFKDRGVKKAPFVVLIGANMPSILAEISFVTNPRDASQLRQPEYRQRVAQSLYKGVAKYAGGLSGTPRVQTARAAGN